MTTKNVTKTHKIKYLKGFCKDICPELDYKDVNPLCMLYKINLTFSHEIIGDMDYGQVERCKKCIKENK
ncbi:MAG: hypothetical protein WC783_00445 [Candidatus Paceibacterota bacterium]|jgi:hypothetical protein